MRKRGNIMTNVIRFNNNLENFQRIVLVYKNLDGTLQMGHTFFYDGRDGSEYLLFLYKDKLDTSKDFLSAWNHLDESSFTTVIVPESNLEVAIDDFLVSFNETLSWKNIDYIPIKDFSEIDSKLKDFNLKLNHAVGFVVEK